MPRKPREKSGSGIYHVILRGVNRQQIFEEIGDYEFMLECLKKIRTKASESGEIYLYRCKIYAYCLMGNHVHLLIRESSSSIGEIIKSLASSYAMYFNRRHCRTGHLFQERFKSEPCTDWSYFVTLLQYIHRNPIKAGITANINYRWSSWHEYIMPSHDNICTTDDVFNHITIQELKSMMIKEDESSSCLEIIENDIPKMLSDDEVRSEIIRLSQCLSISEFQRQDKSRRAEILSLVHNLGASYRQLARISGISFSMIIRESKNQGTGL